MGNTSLKKILILVTVLAVPGFLYYLLQEKGKNRYKPLAFYGPKMVGSTFHMKRGQKVADTIYHQVQDFKLENQDQNSIGFPADTTQITVVNFFFSNCKTVCPIMNQQLSRVVKEYAKNPLIKFYSISVDPGRDTPDVLKKYAAQFGFPSKKWSFLTGSSINVFELSKKSFLLDAGKIEGTNDINHSQMLVLVDPKKRIRGYYDGTNQEQVDKLIDEIKVQIAEELRKVAYQ